MHQFRGLWIIETNDYGLTNEDIDDSQFHSISLPLQYVINHGDGTDKISYNISCNMRNRKTLHQNMQILQTSPRP